MAARELGKWRAEWWITKTLQSHVFYISFGCFCCLPQRQWLTLVGVEHNWVETERPRRPERQLWQGPQALGQIVPIAGLIPALSCVGSTPHVNLHRQMHDLDSDWGNQSSRPWINPCMWMQKLSDLFIISLEDGGTEHQGELWKTF